jgi:hypothetical protein
MATKLIIHGGWGKAGSTALQYFLYQNRARLLSEQNILYPDFFAHKHDSNHNWMAFLLTNAISCDDIDYDNLKKRDPWKELQELITLHDPKTVILSGEAFSCVFYHDFENFHQATREFDIQIILYHRHLLQFIEAMYNQHIKSGFTEDANTFLDNCNVCRARMHAEDVYKKLFETYGNEKITLRLFAKEELYGNNVINDFANLIGINLNNLLMPSGDTNQRIPNQHLEVCRQINLASKDLFEGRERIQCFINYVLQHMDSNKSYSILPEGIDTQLIQQYTTSEKSIADSYFNSAESLLLTHTNTIQANKPTPINISQSIQSLTKELIIPLIDNLIVLKDITISQSAMLSQKQSRPSLLTVIKQKIKNILYRAYSRMKRVSKRSPETGELQ